MSFGIFESALSSEQEVGLARQAAVDQREAAIYDVREKLGPSLFAARDLTEFRDRVAMMKNDQSIYRVIEPHIHPSTGVVRSIVGKNGVLEKEFRAKQDALRSAGVGDFLGDVANNTANAVSAIPAMGVDLASGNGQFDKDLDTLMHPSTGPVNKDVTGMGSPVRQGQRRRADFDGTVDTHSTFTPSSDVLEPKDDWEGYLNSVDQDSAKVDRNFSSAKVAWTVYADWCAANGGLNPTKLASLDRYCPPDPQYFRLAQLIHAWEFGHSPKTPKGQSKEKLKDVTARRGAVVPTTTQATGIDPAAQTAIRGVQGDRMNALDNIAQAETGTGQYGPSGRGVTGADYSHMAPPAGYSEYAEAHGVPHEQSGLVDQPAGYSAFAEQHGAPPSQSGREYDPASPGYKYRKPVDQPAGYSQFAESHGASPAQSGREYDPSTEEYRRRRKRKGSADPLAAYNAWCSVNGYRRISARNVSIFAGNDPALAIDLAQRMRRAIAAARQRQAGEESEESDPDDGFGGKKAPPFGSKEARRRHAAPDYLQKADDALTQLLNQKAQEFQETIAPLQQALTTVQQAEQIQQAQNPLNVLPPPGTVNVMPGADQGPAGMPAAGAPDLGGAAQALAGPLGGGAPPPGGGAPPPGGGEEGAPPPAAAAGGLPPELMQQMQANRARGGYSKGEAVTRPRQASSVFDLWDKYQKSAPTLRGDDSDYEGFASQFGVGAQALNKLKQKHRGPGIGTTVGSRQGVRKGAPFAGYDDFDDCTSKNADKRQPDAYCGEIKHRTEDKTGRRAAWDPVRNPAMIPPKKKKQPTSMMDEGTNSDEYRGYQEFLKNLGLGPKKAHVARLRYLSWCSHHHLRAASVKNFYWYTAQVHPREAAQLTAYSDDDYAGEVSTSDDFNSPAAGHEYHDPLQQNGWKMTHSDDEGHAAWRHPSGHAIAGHDGPDGGSWMLYHPSGQPMGKPFRDPGDAQEAVRRHLMKQGHRKQAWSGWGPSQFPKTRQVTGWDWDNHLNGYLAHRPQHFACECGDSFPTPSGFHRCACGRQWNSYPIGTTGPNHEASVDKFIVREIPVRQDVIVANKQLGALHDLTTPGQLDEGEDDQVPTMKKPPADWARRGDGARWQGSPIGA